MTLVSTLTKSNPLKMIAGHSCDDWCISGSGILSEECEPDTLFFGKTEPGENPEEGDEIIIDGYTFTATNNLPLGENEYNNAGGLVALLETIQKNPYFYENFDCYIDGTLLYVRRKKCGNRGKITFQNTSNFYDSNFIAGSDAVYLDNIALILKVEILNPNGTTSIKTLRKSGTKKVDDINGCFDIRSVVRDFVKNTLPINRGFNIEDCAGNCVIAIRNTGGIATGSRSILQAFNTSDYHYIVDAVLGYEEVETRLKPWSFNDFDESMVNVQFAVYQKEQNICEFGYDWLYMYPYFNFETIDNSFDYTVYYDLYDSSGTLIKTISKFMGHDWKKTKMIPSGLANAIYQMEANVISAGDNGTFNTNILNITPISGIVDLFNTNEEVVSGSKSLKIVIDKTLSGTLTGKYFETNNCTVVNGRTYYLRAWVYVRNGSKIKGIELKTNNGTDTGKRDWQPQNGYDKWHEISTSVVATGTTIKVELHGTQGEASDIFYIDEMTMCEIQPNLHHYDIHVERLKVADSTKILTEKIRYTLNESCEEHQVIYFKNPRGGYERMIINPTLEIALETDKELLIENIECMYDFGTREVTPISNDWNETYYGTTKKIYNKENYKILSMFLYSPDHYIYDGKRFIPIVLNKNTFKVYEKDNIIEVRFSWVNGWINYSN